MSKVGFGLRMEILRGRKELQKIWNVRVKIISLVVSSLGAIPKQFGNRLKEISVTAEIGQVFLGMAKILRKVLEI